jgi:hypothetical protein
MTHFRRKESDLIHHHIKSLNCTIIVALISSPVIEGLSTRRSTFRNWDECSNPTPLHEIFIRKWLLIHFAGNSWKVKHYYRSTRTCLDGFGELCKSEAGMSMQFFTLSWPLWRNQHQKMIHLKIKIIMNLEVVFEESARTKFAIIISPLFDVFSSGNIRNDKLSNNAEIIISICSEKYLQLHFLSHLCRSDLHEFLISDRQNMASTNWTNDSNHAQMKSRSIFRIRLSSSLLPARLCRKFDMARSVIRAQERIPKSWSSHTSDSDDMNRMLTRWWNQPWSITEQIWHSMPKIRGECGATLTLDYSFEFSLQW